MGNGSAKTFVRGLSIAFLVVVGAGLIWLLVDNTDDDTDGDVGDAAMTVVAATGIASLQDNGDETARTLQDQLRDEYDTTVTRVDVSNTTASVVTTLNDGDTDEAVRICESALDVVASENMNVSFILVTDPTGSQIARSANESCGATE